jgi:hypothetical protein
MLARFALHRRLNGRLNGIATEYREIFMFLRIFRGFSFSTATIGAEVINSGLSVAGGRQWLERRNV